MEKHGFAEKLHFKLKLLSDEVGAFSEFHIDKTEYGDYTAIKQQLRRFLDEVFKYKRIDSTLG